jgi:hypothetical protein
VAFGLLSSLGDFPKAFFFGDFMSEAAILLKRFTFEHGGKILELGRPNLGTEAAYGQYMLREEAKFINSEREALGPQAYQDSLRLHMANGTNNWFGWLRPGFLESLSKDNNAARFLWLWFAQKTTTGPKEAFADEVTVQTLYRDPAARPKLTPFEVAGMPATSQGILAQALTDPNPLPLD